MFNSKLAVIAFQIKQKNKIGLASLKIYKKD